MRRGFVWPPGSPNNNLPRRLGSSHRPPSGFIVDLLLQFHWLEYVSVGDLYHGNRPLLCGRVDLDPNTYHEWELSVCATAQDSSIGTSSIRVAAASQLLAIRNILAGIYEGHVGSHVCIISQPHSDLSTLRDLQALLARITPIILRAPSKMSFSTNSTACGFFPTAPSAPNVFALFASTQSPRDTYHMYEDVRQVLCPPSERDAQRKASKSSLKKFFGL